MKRAIENPGLYWITAPSYRQVKAIVWQRLKQVLLPDKDSWKFNEAELSAENIDNKAKIELRGCDNEDSLRGVGIKGVCIDEAASTKANVWPEIIRPMLADYRGWALFTSTPKGKNWFYDLYSLGLDDTQKEYKSWQYPTTINRYIHPDELKAAKLEMPETVYRQEFLAEFIDDDLGVFKKINQCIAGEPLSAEPGRFYVIGVDLAKTADFTVLTVLDSITREIVCVERFKDLLWAEQKFRIQGLAKKYNNALCIVDSTGLGDPVVEDLRFSGVSCDEVKFTLTSKKQLVENLAVALENRSITIPRENDVMIEELKCFAYKVTPSGKLSYAAPEGKHDDCVISLALACWGIRHQLKEAQMYRNEEEDFTHKQGQGTLMNSEDKYLDNQFNSVGY